eukprot:CAMPEP_0201694074 /NCGR_PEP_ID=MMETSP0578-20130828/6458_1 /ASSEMBLY_ACC=CAM_ASM_000663 /TAXON_ID=267565 /ORGANISM="Skeletonema grethea, Strain CCMP 1804" /LENGTH=896 /DNA_ID=CAMNT_0048179701 /DNA_START=23 /DNA_END=2713 /DNA_ORIENTATION=-
MRRMQLYIALTAVCSATAFHTPSRLHPTHIPIGDKKGVLIASPSTYHANSYRRDVSLGLFRDLLRKVTDRGNNGGGDDEQESKDEGDEQLSSTAAVVEEDEEKLATPFFASDFLETRARDATTESAEEVNVVEASDVTTEPEVLPPPTPPQPPVVEVKTPTQAAEELRAQAARIRLEAEKRTVELTLEKIEKLNSQLELMKMKENDDPKSQKSLEEQLLRLKSQLITNENGEIKPVAPPAPAAKKVSTTIAADDSTVQSQPITVSKSTLSSEALEDRVQKFNEAPEFMRILVAKIAGYGVDENTPGAVDRLNATDIVLKLYDDNIGYEDIIRTSDFTDESEREEARRMLERAYEQSGDGGDNKQDKPKFTKEQIQEKVEELDQIPTFLKNIYSKELNDTEMALMLLEEDYENKNKKGGFFGMFGDTQKGEIGKDGERMDVENSGSFSRLFSPEDALNGTSAGMKGGDLPFMIESLYPKSTRKEDETPDKRLVDAFMNDIVASTNSFIPNSNPISVPGGYIVRGTNKCSSGGELIDKLDKRVANDARLREKISFFVLKDPFPDIEDGIIDPFNWPQVLFITGPNVARDPEVILRTLITSLGIATTWYGSIYPFLSNSKLLDKANEAMDLSDAGMPVDMSWLSDMSIPLFLTFIALQLVHEVAHLAVANSKKFEISVPTLVPSILSGITSSITTLKSSPKNKQDLLEFAVAGPLAGMICSILVLSYGLGLTATADAATVANFPGLPLAVLRQSSLGGGLVDIFLGNGVLNVPASAEGAQLLASTMIALHPFAIAGFLSLFVNALAMVPVGRTDGGRVSMAIFGRSGSQGVTFASLLLMFALGFSGESDLLLFYFGFVVFAQSELEIPMRNEIDDVDFSRVFVAGVALFLTILTLIPMQ